MYFEFMIIGLIGGLLGHDFQSSVQEGIKTLGIGQ